MTKTTNINKSNHNRSSQSQAAKKTAGDGPSKGKRRKGETQEQMRHCHSAQSSPAQTMAIPPVWRRHWKVQREGLTLGLDVGDRNSFYCVLNEEAEVEERNKCRTTEDELRAVFGKFPAGTRVALEASTHSAWISRLLEEIGLDVLVGQPRKMPQIYKSVKKNDRVDAEKLARLARLDPNDMGPIHHRSAEMQMDLAVIRSRDALVTVRTKLINTVRCLVKGTGERLPTCSAESFAKQVRALIPEGARAAVGPLVEMIENMTLQIRRYDDQIERLGEKKYPQTELLRQVKGVGPVTSLAFVLTLADPYRFEHSRDVGPYLGLVPLQDESGDSKPQLRITKAGDCYLRRLLVTSAQYILGPFGRDCDLRQKGLELCARGGKNARKRAVVAIARRLAVLLHKLWVSGEVYEPVRDHGLAAVRMSVPVV
jgi:transposase